ncbi:imidazole glycerol phosphate synthase subunit HisH [Aestuariibius sp. 2305UL40-4]|uniref:imidazole glycerol phosphate synthase subunit HisH n=1 Tax=Aestuariibius violaceus TaxID=3234132 RepID=UPI00345EBE05
MTLTVIIDYDSGNLHSAQKAFQRVAREADAGTVEITSDPDRVSRADRIVLPGDGAFPACRRELDARTGMVEAIAEAVRVECRPFLGICVGMQMLATRGLEYEPTPGLAWIDGEVTRILPDDPTLKVPHMGWNELTIDHPHPVLDGISSGDHAYFVHSYHMAVKDPVNLLAHTDHGGHVTAIVGRDTFIGTQFHPEKSQAAGLRLIANFLTWRP